tara:strand:+ start:4040 stop:4945 length:906 start_codon:yes stop_codon:yes gene_type:complete
MKILRSEIRKIIKEHLLKQFLLEVSRKDIQNQVEVNLYDQFSSRFNAASTPEEFDEVEKEYLAAVNQAVEEEMIRQRGSRKASQTKVKIKDAQKWSDLDNMQNTSLAPQNNQSFEPFYDDQSQDVIDVTDPDNPQFVMNRRDFIRNSLLGTAAAAYTLKTGLDFEDIDDDINSKLDAEEKEELRTKEIEESMRAFFYRKFPQYIDNFYHDDARFNSGTFFVIDTSCLGYPGTNKMPMYAYNHEKKSLTLVKKDARDIYDEWTKNGEPTKDNPLPDNVYTYDTQYGLWGDNVEGPSVYGYGY